MRIHKTAPFGIVSLINDQTRRVEIWSYEAIYNAVGVTRNTLLEWQNRYGVDSLGIGDDGEIVAPGFPIFSKVAWMFVDPVDLSTPDTRTLIAECERALANTNDAGARAELSGIRDLALTALERGNSIRFGHP